MEGRMKLAKTSGLVAFLLWAVLSIAKLRGTLHRSVIVGVTVLFLGILVALKRWGGAEVVSQAQAGYYHALIRTGVTVLSAMLFLLVVVLVIIFGSSMWSQKTS